MPLSDEKLDEVLRADIVKLSRIMGIKLEGGIGMEIKWIYAKAFGKLPHEAACVVETLVAIAEQLEQLNKNLEKIKGAINTPK